ncbi:Major royal jelly protein 3 [Orchesella cincta]|uniref:Major royal jelly protein 3 n=1 Tax=Orchesella cincta TaxID=48709 RepID=A0A1D2MGE3_ORCCI|nr:Major royal jelly protein 3 [Orchesella cincta]
MELWGHAGSLLISLSKLGNERAQIAIVCNIFNPWKLISFGRMWIVMPGRVNIFSPSPDNRCPPKLLLVDWPRMKFIKRYEFPDNVMEITRSNVKCDGIALSPLDSTLTSLLLPLSSYHLLFRFTSVLHDEL